MSKWYECKIRYDRVCDDGVTRKVTEAYLVDATSHAEAEMTFAMEMKAFISGESEIIAVKRRIAELFPSKDTDTWWWNAKVSFIIFDEKTGRERRKNVSVMVQGDDMKDALSALHHGMEGTLSDYEVTGLAKSNVLDVIVHDET
jgi:hypothetical protein